MGFCNGEILIAIRIMMRIIIIIIIIELQILLFHNLGSHNKTLY